MSGALTTEIGSPKCAMSVVLPRMFNRPPRAMAFGGFAALGDNRTFVRLPNNYTKGLGARSMRLSKIGAIIVHTAATPFDKDAQDRDATPVPSQTRRADDRPAVRRPDARRARRSGLHDLARPRPHRDRSVHAPATSAH